MTIRLPRKNFAGKNFAGKNFAEAPGAFCRRAAAAGVSTIATPYLSRADVALWSATLDPKLG